MSVGTKQTALFCDPCGHAFKGNSIIPEIPFKRSLKKDF